MVFIGLTGSFETLLLLLPSVFFSLLQCLVVQSFHLQHLYNTSQQIVSISYGVLWYT